MQHVQGWISRSRASFASLISLVHPVVVQPDRFRPLAPRPDNTQATSIIPPAVSANQ